MLNGFDYACQCIRGDSAALETLVEDTYFTLYFSKKDPMSLRNMMKPLLPWSTALITADHEAMPKTSGWNCFSGGSGRCGVARGEAS